MPRDAAAGQRLREIVSRLRTDDERWEDFAVRVGVTKAALWSWFAGQEPSLASLTALARVLGCRRWQLLRAFDGD